MILGFKVSYALSICVVAFTWAGFQPKLILGSTVPHNLIPFDSSITNLTAETDLIGSKNVPIGAM